MYVHPNTDEVQSQTQAASMGTFPSHFLFDFPRGAARGKPVLGGDLALTLEKKPPVFVAIVEFFFFFPKKLVKKEVQKRTRGKKIFFFLPLSDIQKAASMFKQSLKTRLLYENFCSKKTCQKTKV